MSSAKMPETAFLDMQQCLALVSMASRSLRHVGDGHAETLAAFRQVRQVLDLAAVLADGVIEEIEVSNKLGRLA